MVLALISLIFLIGIAYVHHELDPGKPEQRFIRLRRYRKLIFLAVLVFLPMLYMNHAYPDGRKLSPLERLADVDENGTRKEIRRVYDEVLQMYPDSIPLYFRYADARRKGLQTCPIINWSVFTSNQEVIGICNEYHIARCHGDNDELFELGEHNFNLQKTAYANYVRGVRAMTIGAATKAEAFLKQEIRINPNFDLAYHDLFRLYEHYAPEKIEMLLLSDAFCEHLPSDVLQYHYFEKGHYRSYFREVFEKHYLHIHPLAFFAGLVISLIWLIYLRSLDVFRKERWIDIAIVFIGGVFFTLFCIPMYHYAHFELDMSITGHSLNDFIYCAVVIGGSEETVKMLPWVIFALTTRKMKEPYDYLLYASVAALGFAFAENWMYLEDPNNIVGRFIMSTVAHMFDACVFAYSVVLARYRFKQLFWKITIPIIGFILACLCHGFYDFWLISPSTSGLQVVTLIFFILSIHVWFHLKNNAINHSQYYRSQPFDLQTPITIFMFGVVGILMLEYVLTSYEYGAHWANYNLRWDAVMVGAFLLYMNFNLKNIQPVRGAWKKYSLPRFRLFSKSIFTLPESGNSEVLNEDLRGLKLRLYTPKSNPFIGQLLPVSGQCEDSLSIEGQDNWMIFRLNTALDIANFHQDLFIVRAKELRSSLSEDKVEIYLLLVPLNVQFDHPLSIKELRYTGRAFSRPI